MAESYQAPPLYLAHGVLPPPPTTHTNTITRQTYRSRRDGNFRSGFSQTELSTPPSGPAVRITTPDTSDTPDGDTEPAKNARAGVRTKQAELGAPGKIGNLC